MYSRRDRLSPSISASHPRFTYVLDRKMIFRRQHWDRQMIFFSFTNMQNIRTSQIVRFHSYESALAWAFWMWKFNLMVAWICCYLFDDLWYFGLRFTISWNYSMSKNVLWILCANGAADRRKFKICERIHFHAYWPQEFVREEKMRVRGMKTRKNKNYFCDKPRFLCLLGNDETPSHTINKKREDENEKKSLLFVSETGTQRWVHLHSSAALWHTISCWWGLVNVCDSNQGLHSYLN